MRNHALQPGSMLLSNTYRIERVLGRGGFGITYLATDINIDRQVAIKEFFPGRFCERDTDFFNLKNKSGESPTFIEDLKKKFLKEARTIAKLKHDNIIKVITAFEQNNTAYYVMEYIEGESLSEKVKRSGPLSRSQAIEYIGKVGRALEYLHTRKINHLDVKPANIMISNADDQPILIDFGVSKHFDSNGLPTSITPIAYSPGYAPIEQSSNKGNLEFNPQADIYSLAATLYYILSGVVPIESPRLINQELNFPPSIPSDIISIIRKGMSSKIINRHASINSFLADLHHSSGLSTNEDTEIAVDNEETQFNEPEKEKPIIYNQSNAVENHPSNKKRSPYKKYKRLTYIGLFLILFFPVLFYKNGYGYTFLGIDQFLYIPDYEWFGDTWDWHWFLVSSIGSGIILLIIGLYHLLDGNVPSSYSTKLVKLAEKGFASAQYNLGCCYAHGDGIAKNAAEAVKWFRLAAEQGYVDAQYNLGICYENGYGVIKNLTEAAKWYRKGAEQGMAKAQYNLGGCYANGEGVAKNATEAVKWYHKAAEQGNANAQYNLAVCYKNGYGIAKNGTEAVKWYRKAAEQGNAAAQYNLGVCYYNGLGVSRSYEEAVNWYRKAAKQGNADAQFNLGVCYKNGYGITKNIAEAIKWYRKAAEQGMANAQYNLGICYKTGHGVTKNYAEAVKCYRKAAEQGYAKAQYNLGICYEKGDGVTKNMVEAVKWYRKAAEQGIANAQFDLGICYEIGEGVAKNTTEAVKWYRKAAKQGFASAQCNLGVCYKKGEGIEKNYEEAVKWYRKAAEQGKADAQCRLGACYFLGEGVTQNYEEAVKWYRKAAEQGDATAQLNLGVYYCIGKGVTQNYEEAVKWFRKAAEQGDAPAQHNLGACYANGKGVNKNTTEAVKWFRKAAEQGDQLAKDALQKLGY